MPSFPSQLMTLLYFSLKWQKSSRNKSHNPKCKCEKIQLVFYNRVEIYLSHSTDGRKLNSRFLSLFRIFSVSSDSVHPGLLSSLYSSQGGIKDPGGLHCVIRKRYIFQLWIVKGLGKMTIQQFWSKNSVSHYKIPGLLNSRLRSFYFIFLIWNLFLLSPTPYILLLKDARNDLT